MPCKAEKFALSSRKTTFNVRLKNILFKKASFGRACLRGKTRARKDSARKFGIKRSVGGIVPVLLSLRKIPSLSKFLTRSNYLKKHKLNP